MVGVTTQRISAASVALTTLSDQTFRLQFTSPLAEADGTPIALEPSGLIMTNFAFATDPAVAAAGNTQGVQLTRSVLIPVTPAPEVQNTAFAI